jgi:hypothetical protein
MQKFLIRVILSLMVVLSIALVGVAQQSLAVGDTINATADDAVVDYSLSLETGQTVVIDLQSDNFDSYIEVRQDSTVLAFNDDGGENVNSLLEFTAPETGVYTVRVRSFIGNPNGDYMLAVRASAATEQETDMAAQPSGDGTLTVGGSVTATANNEIVPYTVTLDAGMTYIISLNSDDFDPYLEVQDSTGTLIAENDDDAFSLNSEVTLTPNSTGEYTIRVRSAFGPEADGNYTLALAPLTTTEIAIGDPITTEADGSANVYVYTFTAEAGDVINIAVDSQDDEDTRLYLYAPDQSEVASDDDSGAGLNPLVRRQELQEGGTYTLEVESYSGEPIVSDLNVAIEPTEILDLNAGTIDIRMGSDVTQDTLSLEVETGATYVITVTASEVLDSTLFGDLTEPGEDFANLNFSFRGTNDIAFLYEANTTGRVTINLRYEAFGGSVDFSIAAEELE